MPDGDQRVYRWSPSRLPNGAHDSVYAQIDECDGGNSDDAASALGNTVAG